MKEKLSLIIPTFNEADNIIPLCKLLVEILSKEGIFFEIIIVDDDSPDGTWQLAQTFAEREKSIRVIRRMREKGLSTAVITGWAEADGEILGVMDGDLQHSPEVLPTMIKMFQNKEVDIVVASRNIKGGGVSEWSILRRFISWGGTLVSTFFLPETIRKVKDSMSGFFLLRRQVIQGKLLTPIGYKILLEILAKGYYREIVEVPYIFYERKNGGSKLGLKQYTEFLIHLLRLSTQTREIYRVLRYTFVGAEGAFITILVYWLGIHSNFSPPFAYVCALELAIINSFIMNEKWTFKDKSKLHSDLKSRIRRLIKFNLIHLYGAIISLLSFLFLTRVMSLKLIFGALIGIGIGFIWNYGASANIAWISKLYQRRLTPDVEEGYYHRVIKENRIQRYWHYKKFDIISKKINSSPILDIGSGPGVFFYLHKRPGIKINLDISYDQLKYGKRLNPEAHYVMALANHLPFADGSFQIVCLIETIEHLKEEEARQTLSEVYRVLKKGGQVIISTPNYRSSWPLLEKIVSFIGPVNYIAQHVNHFNMNKLARYVRWCGLAIKSKETFFIFAPFLSIFSIRISNLIQDIERKLFPQWGCLLLIGAIKE